jgi:hypothetical protein
MICLRCGYCCIYYDVMIVNNPDLGIIEGNIIHKPYGIKCQHLIGEIPGEYACKVHNSPWFKETPCAAFTQFESQNSNCRVGEKLCNMKQNPVVIFGDETARER